MSDTKDIIGPTRATTLPEDPKLRKQYPLASGLFDYFPDALVAISRVSFIGNEQHNPGQPLHWARNKSGDEADCILRHFAERGKIDKDGIRESARMAWRALAFLQKEIEADTKPQAETQAVEPAIPPFQCKFCGGGMWNSEPKALLATGGYAHLNCYAANPPKRGNR